MVNIYQMANANLDALVLQDGVGNVHIIVND